MKRAHHLFEQVASFSALLAAAGRAARGHRHTTGAARFLVEKEVRCLALERELVSGEWSPHGYETFTVHDPKTRLISAAPFVDRVVHHAICTPLEPVLERWMLPHSHACRRGRGTHGALREALRLTRRYGAFLKLDVRHHFETIDHAVLKGVLRSRIKDRRFLELCNRITDFGAPGSPPGRGLPIGNLTSQHFANAFLTPLDHLVVHRLRPSGYVRYMDDLLLFDDSQCRLAEHEVAIATFLSESLRLDVKTEATRRGAPSSGVPFLGFRLFPGVIRLLPSRRRRLRKQLQALDLLGRVPGHESEQRRRADALLSWTARSIDARGLTRDWGSPELHSGAGAE
jgi:RNA-directed DNA polymerase